MSYYEPTVVAAVKQLDLQSYLERYDPHELVPDGHGEYRTRTHDSLTVSHGLWHWHSRGIGGRSALDYLIKVKGLTFTDAVGHLVEKAGSDGILLSQTVERSQKARERGGAPEPVLMLPHRSDITEHAEAYLASRGIDRGIVRDEIRSGRIYESSPTSGKGSAYHNVVFVGFDTEGTPRHAMLRGIGTDFKRDATGSDKRYSFSIPAARESDRLHVFESAIDLLSYATLMKMRGAEFRGRHLLSLSGAYAPHADKAELPAALTQYLTDHPEVTRIALHLDNDIPGRTASGAIVRAAPNGIIIEDRPPKTGKDVNDALMQTLRPPHIRDDDRDDRER